MALNGAGTSVLTISEIKCFAATSKENGHFFSSFYLNHEELSFSSIAVTVEMEIHVTLVFI